TRLTSLDLGSNDLRDGSLAPLGTGSLTLLARLCLDQNHLTDLTPLGSMYNGANPNRKLPALAYLDASGQAITMPELSTSLNSVLTLGPAKWDYHNGYRDYTLVAPPSGGTANRLTGGTARGSIPAAPSPINPDTTWKDGNGTPIANGTWPKDTYSNSSNGTIPTGAGTMNWARRGPGTYTYGFRTQKTQGAGINSTPAGADGTMIFSGTITQKVTYSDGGCTVDSSTITDCFTNSDGDKLPKAVANALGKTPSSTFTSTDTTAASLNLAGKGLKDLTHLDRFWWLDTLDLSGNQISDLTPLKDNTLLTSLNLNNNKLTDLTNLNRLTRLTSLDLGSNDLRDGSLAPLGTGSLTLLARLCLDQNHLTDLTPLGSMYNGANPNRKLPALAYLDASGQAITMPELSTSLNSVLTLGPAKWDYHNGYRDYTLVAPPSGGTANRLTGGTARGSIPAAPSPINPDTTWKDGNGTPIANGTWPKDTYSNSSNGTIPTGAGTMNWARRGPGTYTYGFRTQKTQGAGINSTPAGADGTMIFSGTITQKVYKYDVTFKPGNGEADWTQHVYSDKAIEPSQPSWMHYTFKGWYTAATGGSKWDFDTKLTDSITLYGQWEPIMHLVVIDTDGGTGPTSRTIHEGDPIGAILTAKEGHHLGTPAWVKVVGNTETPWNLTADPVTAPMSVKAKWQPDQYTVRFANPDSTATPPADQSVPYGSGPTDPGAPTPPDYGPSEATPAFKGWWTPKGKHWDFSAGGSTIGHDELDDPGHTMTLTARWTRQVTISFDLGGAPGATPAGRTIDKGDTLAVASLPAVSWSGHAFQGWCTDNPPTRPWTGGTVSANMTLHAKWALIHTVTIHANWPGASPSTATRTIIDGRNASSELAGLGWSRPGWTRTRWTLDQAGTQPYTNQPITTDMDIWAQWSPNLTQLPHTGGPLGAWTGPVGLGLGSLVLLAIDGLVSTRRRNTRGHTLRR
ncbi:hypothetical protein CRD60_05150, partial [Bifidobacterium aemilianum]